MGIPLINLSFFKRMLNQVNDDKDDLDIESSNKTEVELAKSSAEIDEKVSKYGSSSKVQRSQTLKDLQVDSKTLKASKVNNSKDSKSKESVKQASESEKSNDDGRDIEF